MGLRPYASENGPTKSAVVAQAVTAVVTSCAAMGIETASASAISTSRGPSIATAVIAKKTAKAMLARRSR